MLDSTNPSRQLDELESLLERVRQVKEFEGDELLIVERIRQLMVSHMISDTIDLLQQKDLSFEARERTKSFVGALQQYIQERLTSA